MYWRVPRYLDIHRGRYIRVGVQLKVSFAPHVSFRCPPRSRSGTDSTLRLSRLSPVTYIWTICGRWGSRGPAPPAGYGVFHSWRSRFAHSLIGSGAGNSRKGLHTCSRGKFQSQGPITVRRRMIIHSCWWARWFFGDRGAFPTCSSQLPDMDIHIYQLTEIQSRHPPTTFEGLLYWLEEYVHCF